MEKQETQRVTKWLQAAAGSAAYLRHACATSQRPDNKKTWTEKEKWGTQRVNEWLQEAASSAALLQQGHPALTLAARAPGF
eukprot:1154234-Pelagomonas_calceolata.AAC.9